MLLTCGGCANRDPQHAAPSRVGRTIAVGQAWPQARDVARRAGYRLQDASQLAMLPTPDGFYIDLPAGQGLIAYRDSRTNLVEAIQWVEDWNKSKSSRVYHIVQSFAVPPAGLTAR